MRTLVRLRRCSYETPWGSGWRCPRVTLSGLCLEHRLQRIRGDWTLGPLRLSVDLGAVNQPTYNVDDDKPANWASVSFGTPGVDPVLMLEWNRTRAKADD